MNVHGNLQFSCRDLLKTTARVASGGGLLSSATLAVDEDAKVSFIEAYPDRLSYEAGDEIQLSVSPATSKTQLASDSKDDGSASGACSLIREATIHGAVDLRSAGTIKQKSGAVLVDAGETLSGYNHRSPAVFGGRWQCLPGDRVLQLGELWTFFSWKVKTSSLWGSPIGRALLGGPPRCCWKPVPA